VLLQRRGSPERLSAADVAAPWSSDETKGRCGNELGESQGRVNSTPIDGRAWCDVCSRRRERAHAVTPNWKAYCGNPPAVFLSPKPLPDARTVTAALPVHASLAVAPSPSARSPPPRPHCASRVAGLALRPAEATIGAAHVRTLAAVNCIFACASPHPSVNESRVQHDDGSEHELQGGRADAAGGPQRHCRTRHPAGRCARAGHWCVVRVAACGYEGGSTPATLDPDAVGQRRLLIWMFRVACVTRRAGCQHAKPQPFFWAGVGVNPRVVGHGHAVEMQARGFHTLSNDERIATERGTVGSFPRGGNGMGLDSAARCKHPEVEGHDPPARYPSNYAVRGPIARVGRC
jgi:hypothetical protein